MMVNKENFQNNLKSVELRLNHASLGKLLYFGDPMCSWCWGISNHLENLIKHYQNGLEFELVLGGLRPGGGDPWNKQVKDFIKKHWNHVHKKSGQPFNYSLFEIKNFNYDTEPPSRAVRVIRDLFPGYELDFFRQCQYQFYVKNHDPANIDFYKPIFNNLKLNNWDIFEDRFLSLKYRALLQNDFIKSQQYGIRGFPSIMLELDNYREIIAFGYSTLQEMINKIDEVLIAH